MTKDHVKLTKKEAMPTLNDHSDVESTLDTKTTYLNHKWLISPFHFSSFFVVELLFMCRFVA